MKSIARLAFACAALLLVSSAVFGQTPSPKALQQFDSLASASRTARVEMAACVASSAATIDSLTPASYVDADTVTVYEDDSAALLCAPGVASIHTHVHGITTPSALDRRTKQRSGSAFALILAIKPDSWLLVRY